MVTSSTLIPPSVDVKPSSSTLLTRKDSNASSSGAFSEASRSFGQEENSNDSFYGLTSSTLPSHYVIKCSLGSTNTSTSSTPTPTSSLPPPTPPSITPRVKVTVQQPSITARTSRFDSSPDPVSASTSSTLLKTPTTSNIALSTTPKVTTSMASSAPEFSISGASSIDDSEEIALYEQYLSISHARQSNPSPEMRKKMFEDWTQTQQRGLPRSRSEVHTSAIESSQSEQQQQYRESQEKEQQQRRQQTITKSQIKAVGKFLLLSLR